MLLSFYIFINLNQFPFISSRWFSFPNFIYSLLTSEIFFSCVFLFYSHVSLIKLPWISHPLVLIFFASLPLAFTYPNYPHIVLTLLLPSSYSLAPSVSTRLTLFSSLIYLIYSLWSLFSLSASSYCLLDSFSVVYVPPYLHFTVLLLHIKLSFPLKNNLPWQLQPHFGKRKRAITSTYIFLILFCVQIRWWPQGFGEYLYTFFLIYSFLCS